MLRRLVRQPSGVAPLARAQRRASSAAAVEKDSEERHDGYGLEYGAGPSRIPYEPLGRSMTSGTAQAGYALAGDRPLKGVSLAPGSSLASARAVRHRLAHISHGHYTDLSTFANAALRQSQGAAMKRRSLPSARPISVLSRLELHVLVHHLIRCGQPILAASLMSEAIRAGVSSRPKRRRLFAARTIEFLLRGYPDLKINRTPIKATGQSQDAAPSIIAFTQNKQLASFSTALLPRQTRALLDLLSSMQEVRHRRSPEMYSLLIKQCIQERRPDAAAKVFVGLVEEWVTEGRVAEGADVDDFCEGGGPSKKLEIQLVSDQMATWWQGVRTWKLPGEVLSPHGRLDLWHPKNLSLGEKMKGFPMPVPTSPPSMVPAPNNDLLTEIIDSLHVDPATCSPEDHTASMRALAYLANTVLSRTLPLSSLRALFTAMAATKHRPAVYPESIDIDQIPESDRWAYESFTQIHLALQSLLSAPPMSTSSLEYVNQVERARKASPAVPVHPPPPPSPYMLRPLSWTSCLELLRYGISRLRSPALIRNLVVYMKQVFGEGHTSPKAHNVMLEGATRLRDESLGRMISKALFGPMFTATPSKTPSNDTVPKATDHEIIPASHQTLAIDHPDSRLSPEADERSLTALILHLTAASRFSELETLIYELIPSLSRDVSRTREAPRPDDLPLALFPVLLEGLRKAGKTGLAQKVYKVALQDETAAITRHVRVSSALSYERGQRPQLPIELFTTMLSVWANEVRASKNGGQWVKGWRIARKDGVHKRADAAQLMAWRTYIEARHRWRDATRNGKQSVFVPDTGFYHALFKACGGRWRLDEPEWPSAEARRELEQIVSDMKAFGITIPAKAARKLGVNQPIKGEKPVRQREGRDPAIDLAEMMFEQEGHREQPERSARSDTA